MKKMDFQKVIEWLSFVLRCPVCSYKYNLERTKIVDAKQDNQEHANLLVHSDCAQCKSSVVFSISIDGPEVFTLGLVSDLTSSDTDRFVDQTPLNSNDVLDIRKFVREFDGDLVKALS